MLRGLDHLEKKNKLNNSVSYLHWVCLVIWSVSMLLGIWYLNKSNFITMEICAVNVSGNKGNYDA